MSQSEEELPARYDQKSSTENGLLLRSSSLSVELSSSDTPKSMLKLNGLKFSVPISAIDARHSGRRSTACKTSAQPSSTASDGAFGTMAGQ